MKRIASEGLLMHMFIAALPMAGAIGCATRKAAGPLAYPTTRAESVVDIYHGHTVADPYRWLENRESAEVQAWVEAQNEVARAFFESLPNRRAIRSRLRQLYDYPRYGGLRKEGGRYFFSKNAGLQNQAVLYTRTSLHGKPTVLLDPNRLSKDGTVALSGVGISKDGSLMAYSLSRSGSDWQEIRIRHVDTGEDFPEVLHRCKFSPVAWMPDNTGFFYARFPDAGTVPPQDENNYHRVYWHALGTPQSEDRLVFERPDFKELTFYPIMTDDGRYLVLSVHHGTDERNRVYYREAAGDGPFVRLLDAADARYDFIGNIGPVFYFLTDLDAPRGRIIAIDINRPDRANWREIIPQHDDVLAFAALVNRQFAVAWNHDVHHILKLYGLDGQWLHDIPLPGLGTVAELWGKPDDAEMFFAFTSFLFPTTFYRYDFQTQTLEPYLKSTLDFDPSGYETRQVFYVSKDGTRVPMYITHKKGIVLDGNNPTLLYGYGGFSASIMPSFSAARLFWLERGGVYAVANLRGGSEYGEEWHRAGMLANKQNVFDDFIAAAEWLIQNHYTSPRRLAIEGRSNGGLLVAACMVQRPDLFGAVVCGVPVADMLRYHKFTVGRYWIPEYGNAEASEREFKTLLAYSPLHNVQRGTAYPPILILTAETDDRVVPSHGWKFAAALQAAGGPNPVLLYTETKAGHGHGKPMAKVIEEQANVFGFLFNMLGRQDEERR